MTIHYTVKSIEGEYAVLRDASGEELFIALALLPEGTDIGSKLLFEDFNYQLLQQ